MTALFRRPSQLDKTWHFSPCHGEPGTLDSGLILIKLAGRLSGNITCLVASATKLGESVSTFSVRSYLRVLVTCLFASAITAGPAFSQNGSPNSPRPVAEAFALTVEPVLDGNVLDDPAWIGARPISDFWQTQPNSGRAATQKTEVFVGYTDTAIHIGVIAYDDAPLQIITTDTRRDSSLDDTDAFKVAIDGLLDRQNAYVFGTNSAGVEYDGQVNREGQSQFVSGGSGGLNLNWDAPWSVKSAISDIGWSAEFRIPFSSLRYGPDEVQVWGFNFERRIRRNNEVAYWAPLSQDRDILRISEAGSIGNIRAPRPTEFTIHALCSGQTGRRWIAHGHRERSGIRL